MLLAPLMLRMECDVGRCVEGDWILEDGLVDWDVGVGTRLEVWCGWVLIG